MRCIITLICFTVAFHLRDERAKESPLPQLAGKCAWGIIEQDHHALQIKAVMWSAYGVIRHDNSVVFCWRCCSDDRTMLGVYRLDNNDILGGHYGDGEKVSFDAAGNLTGEIIADAVQITRTK